MDKVLVDNNNLSKGENKATGQVSQSVTISNAGMTSLPDHHAIRMHQGARKTEINKVADRIVIGIEIVTVTRGLVQKAGNDLHKTIHQNDI